MNCQLCEGEVAELSSATVDGHRFTCCGRCKQEVDRVYNSARWYLVQWVEDRQLMFAGTRLECEKYVARFNQRDQHRMEILGGGQ